MSSTLPAEFVAKINPDKPVSWFEFLSPNLFYIPFVIQWFFLGIRYLSWTLPTAANPGFDAGGLYGESKDQVLGTAGPAARDWVAPHVALHTTGHVAKDIATAKQALEDAGLDLPLVAKPDMGCRGNGVRPIRDWPDLQVYLEGFPTDELLILQEMADLPGEAGVFYVRHPGAPHGEIISLTLKYFPHVTGDGQSTLQELIQRDPRAGRLFHIYAERHADRLDQIVPQGESIRLGFAGSHSRGAIFRNGNAHITPEMTARFDRIADDVDGFYFGRLDVRYESLEQLKKGEGFRIVEINGAGSEATHIWDAETTLREAWGTLFKQYRLAFEIGAANRKRGCAPMGGFELLRLIARQRKLAKDYPATH